MDSLDPKTFLTPFLDVIRSEAVTGSVTGMALDSVHKFLAYQILHPDMPEVATAVENLADAVTHARFVGLDPSSDEVVLMKILALLRLLMVSPVGLLLTNESVCEIMQSTFRYDRPDGQLPRKPIFGSMKTSVRFLANTKPRFVSVVIDGVLSTSVSFID